MRRFHPLLAILLALVLGASTRAGEPDRAAPASFDAQRFYLDLRLVVRRHYPEATAHRLGEKIHFEHRTRIFVIHEALKTGEWQDPVEERGPTMGGVHCDLEFRRGQYGGAAEVPQVFDKRYFTVLLLAPYSERLVGYRYVHLQLPGHGTVPEGFEDDIRRLIDDFGAYAAGD